MSMYVLYIDCICVWSSQWSEARERWAGCLFRALDWVISGPEAWILHSTAHLQQDFNLSMCKRPLSVSECVCVCFYLTVALPQSAFSSSSSKFLSLWLQVWYSLLLSVALSVFPLRPGWTFYLYSASRGIILLSCRVSCVSLRYLFFKSSRRRTESDGRPNIQQLAWWWLMILMIMCKNRGIPWTKGSKTGGWDPQTLPTIDLRGQKMIKGHSCPHSGQKFWLGATS